MPLSSEPDPESQASANANADCTVGRGDRRTEQSHAFRMVHRLPCINALVGWCRGSLTYTLLAVSLIAGMLAVEEPPSVSYAALTTITIDGNGSDWAGTA